MAKILVQFNETTSKATSQGNLDDRMISFFDDGVSNEGFAYRKANDTYMNFSSDEHIADVTNDFASSIGISWSGAATDVNAAIEEVNSNIVADHGGLTGLADDDHSQYFLLAGRTGAQTATLSTDNDGTIEGSDAANGNLILISTSNATKGEVLIGTSTNTNALVNFPFATTAKAAISLPTSTAVDPAAPNEGDLWYNGTNLYFRDSSGNCDILVGSGGDFSGPASSTDNAIVRFGGTGGKTGQNSGVIIDDSDNVTGITNLIVDGGLAVTNEVGIDANYGLYRVDSTALGALIGTRNATPINFITNDTVKAVLTSDGNHIIGGTSSTLSAVYDKNLEIKGTSTASIVIQGNATGSDANIGEFSFLNNSAGETYKRIASIRGRRLVNDNSGGLTFNVTLNSTLSEAMRIDENGDVYLNNTAATTARELNISNSASTTAVSQQFTNGSSGTTSTDGFLIGIDNAATPNAELVNFESSSMIFKTSNTERMSLSSAGVLQVKDLITTDGTGTEQMVIADDQGDLDTVRLPGGALFESCVLVKARSELDIGYQLPHYTIVYVNRKTRLSKLSCWIKTSAGSTQIRMAIYDSSKNKLDEGTVTTSSTGLVSVNLAGVNIAADDYYYLAILKNTNNATTIWADLAVNSDTAFTFQGAGSASSFPSTESTSNTSTRSPWIGAY